MKIKAKVIGKQKDSNSESSLPEKKFKNAKLFKGISIGLMLVGSIFLLSGFIFNGNLLPSSDISIEWNFTRTYARGTIPIKAEITSAVPLRNTSFYMNDTLINQTDFSSGNENIPINQFVDSYTTERFQMLGIENISSLIENDNEFLRGHAYNSGCGGNNIAYVRFFFSLQENNLPTGPAKIILNYEINQIKSNDYVKFQIYNPQNNSYQTLSSETTKKDVNVVFSIANIQPYLDIVGNRIEMRFELKNGNPGIEIEIDQLNLEWNSTSEFGTYQHNFAYSLKTRNYSDGWKNLTIISEDANGYKQSQSRLVYFDNSAPTINAFEIRPEQDRVIFAGDFEDNDDLKYIQISWYGESGDFLTQNVKNDLGKNYSFEFANYFANGSYVFNLVCGDEAGNKVTLDIPLNFFFQHNYTLIQYQNISANIYITANFSVSENTTILTSWEEYYSTTNIQTISLTNTTLYQNISLINQINLNTNITYFSNISIINNITESPNSILIFFPKTMKVNTTEYLDLTFPENITAELYEDMEPITTIPSGNTSVPFLFNETGTYNYSLYLFEQSNLAHIYNFSIHAIMPEIIINEIVENITIHNETIVYNTTINNITIVNETIENITYIYNNTYVNATYENPVVIEYVNNTIIETEMIPIGFSVNNPPILPKNTDGFIQIKILTDNTRIILYENTTNTSIGNFSIGEFHVNISYPEKGVRYFTYEVFLNESLYISDSFSITIVEYPTTSNPTTTNSITTDTTQTISDDTTNTTESDPPNPFENPFAEENAFAYLITGVGIVSLGVGAYAYYRKRG